jgi:hypothetical protein
MPKIQSVKTKKIGIICAFLLNISLGVFSEELIHEEFGWGIHIPSGWGIFEMDETVVTFSNPTGEAFIQVYTFDGSVYLTSEAILGLIEQGFGAQLEIAPIDYKRPSQFATNLGDVSLGYLLIEQSTFPVEGYALAFNEDHQDVLVFAFGKLDLFLAYADLLISSLDSFIPSVSDFQVPGAFSQFLSESSPSFQDIIDREARILQSYGEAPLEIKMDAWRRFYQIIYRDSFMSLANLADEIDRNYMGLGIPKHLYAQQLLSDLQSFEFIRTGNLADLAPPIVCYNTQTGDCDSLALLYMGILEHWGIKSILMISDIHKHAMVGVDVVGEGAKFTLNGKSYLVAELTEEVSLGMIAAEMADPADWFGFDLQFSP